MGLDPDDPYSLTNSLKAAGVFAIGCTLYHAGRSGSPTTNISDSSDTVLIQPSPGASKNGCSIMTKATEITRGLALFLVSPKRSGTSDLLVCCVNVCPLRLVHK